MKTSQVNYITADANSAAQRIDNFLVRTLKGVPKSHIYKILRKGEVRVNKKRVKPTYKLQIDDIIRIPPVRQFENTSPKPSNGLIEALQAATLFEDDSMLILNKPAGLAVHGGSGINLGIIEALRSYYPSHSYLELVHRIDKATSGCLMVAKKRSFLRHAQTELRERRVDKTYLALLHGKLRKTIQCHAPLLKTSAQNGEKIVRVHQTGKTAHSIFQSKQKFTAITLSKIRILTGRTHQIRVHAAYQNLPIIGDEKYGVAVPAALPKRMYLHAATLALTLSNGERFSIEAPLDQKFTRALEHLHHDR